MNAESFIKSNIAVTILTLMLKDSGYRVLSLRNNELLDRLLQDGVKNIKITKLLLNTPNFIVIDKKNDPIPVSVKFRGQGKSGGNIDWGFKQISEYWPETLMVVVSNRVPYFSIFSCGKLVSLEDSVLKINKKTSENYAHLIEKFLK